MKMHLVDTMRDCSIGEVRQELATAHDFLASRALVALADAPVVGPLWGILMKRLKVDLCVPNRPSVVRKESERLGEVVNMVATIERLIAALAWFEAQPEFAGLRVKECHPSTSSATGSNDLMLEDATGRVVVRCEVCDVASTSASQNGKEAKDVRNLGCEGGVPADGVRRFICTSPEFAEAIQKAKRKWGRRHHRYLQHVAGDAGATTLVELVPVGLANGPP